MSAKKAFVFAAFIARRRPFFPDTVYYLNECNFTFYLSEDKSIDFYDSLITDSNASILLILINSDASEY